MFRSVIFYDNLNYCLSKTSINGGFVKRKYFTKKNYYYYYCNMANIKANVFTQFQFKYLSHESEYKILKYFRYTVH